MRPQAELAIFSAMVPYRFACHSPTPSQRRLAHFLTQGDPLADEVIESLSGRAAAEQEALVSQLVSRSSGPFTGAMARLREQLETMPAWFDAQEAAAGGAVLLRNGMLSGLVLALKSLVLGYCSPAGNKPLMFSGRLVSDVQKRLAETARFVEAVCQPQGLALARPGFVAAVRVRLMHARIRNLLVRSPKWRADEWGLPINQYDEAGTILLFSSELLDGLEKLGVTLSPSEYEATLHLWRAVGWLMGVDSELLVGTRADARRLWQAIESTQALPDDDSRTLTMALIRSGAPPGAEEQGALAFSTALCRHLVGPTYANALSLNNSAWDLAPRLLKRLVMPFDRMRQSVPTFERQFLRIGARYWRHTIEMTLGNRDVAFTLPTEGQVSAR
jgi:hypothetical protein